MLLWVGGYPCWLSKEAILKVTSRGLPCWKRGLCSKGWRDRLQRFPSRCKVLGSVSCTPKQHPPSPHWERTLGSRKHSVLLGRNHPFGEMSRPSGIISERGRRREWKTLLFLLPSADALRARVALGLGPRSWTGLCPPRS